MRRFLILAGCLAITFIMGAGILRAETPKQLLVFAAASLKPAMEPLGRAFEERTGVKVTFSFAATSALARQVSAGAGADIFISADLDWVEWLQAKGLTAPETQRIIARNRLALVAAASQSFATDQTIFDVLRKWKNVGGGRLAIADPAHVPAGRYARAALLSLVDVIGPYETLSQNFAIANNVRLAAFYVANEVAPLGIVYLSDVKTNPGLRLIGLFPENAHPEILYPAVKMKNASVLATSFLDFLETPEAQTLLTGAGLQEPINGN